MTHVKDSKKPVEIAVTHDHCQKGTRGDKGNCIIAVAAKEQTRGFITDVRVGLRYTTFALSSGDRLRYSTPTCLGKKLEAFDRGGALLPPGTYRFNPPRRSESIDYQRKMFKKYRAPGYRVKRRHKATRKVQSRKVVLAKLMPVNAV